MTYPNQTNARYMYGPLCVRNSHQQPPSAEHKSGKAGAHAHKPLQRLELDLLQLLAQRCHLLLDLGLRLLDLELLRHSLLADPALLEIQIEPDASLRAPNLVAQPAVKFGEVVVQPLVCCSRRVGLRTVGGEKLASQLSEVDFLRVRRLGGVLAKDHGACEILYARGKMLAGGAGDGKGAGQGRAGAVLPLLYHVVQDLHHGYRLLFREALFLQPLHELERVEVVVPSPCLRSLERAPQQRGVGGLPQAPCHAAAGNNSWMLEAQRPVRAPCMK